MKKLSHKQPNHELIRQTVNMPSRAYPFQNPHAFTLLEVLIIITIVSILGCVMLPAMAKTRVRTTGAGCLSNLKQMMIGWALYKDDNNDVLVPNNNGSQIGWINSNCSESYSANSGNTNQAAYKATLLSPYLNNHIELYRCPADIIPSANGLRIRTYSMNGMISPSASLPSNPQWYSFFKTSQLICPGPQNTFVFADESMGTLNDGYLQMSLTTPLYPDCPANYHEGACGLSFADGHAEIHKWMWASSSGGLRNVPNGSGFGYPAGANWPSSATDVDWLWLRAHSSCQIQ